MDIRLEPNQAALLFSLNDDGTGTFEIVDNFEEATYEETSTVLSVLIGLIGAQMMDPQMVQGFAESMIDWWNERGDDLNDVLDDPISANSNQSPKLEVIDGGKKDDTDGG